MLNTDTNGNTPTPDEPMLSTHKDRLQGIKFQNSGSEILELMGQFEDNESMKVNGFPIFIRCEKEEHSIIMLQQLLDVISVMMSKLLAGDEEGISCALELDHSELMQMHDQYFEIGFLNCRLLNIAVLDVRRDVRVELMH